MPAKPARRSAKGAKPSRTARKPVARTAKRAARKVAPARKAKRASKPKPVRNAVRKAAPKKAKATRGKKAPKRAPAVRMEPAQPRPGAWADEPAKGESEFGVRAYIAALPDWQKEVATRFDDMVTEEVPHARRAIKWNAPFYGVEGNGWFVSLAGFKQHLSLRFFKGVALDPAPPKGESGETRTFDLKGVADFDEDRIRGWVRQAAAMPGWGARGSQ